MQRAEEELESQRQDFIPLFSDDETTLRKSEQGPTVQAAAEAQPGSHPGDKLAPPQNQQVILSAITSDGTSRL